VLLLASALLASAAGCARTPRRDDFLRVRLPHDPPTLDPALAADVSSSAVLLPIFETLVEADPSTLEIGPGLAERWEVSPDGLRYTFYLRAAARFHHTRPVEAEDVVFSLRRLLRYDRPSPAADILDPVEGAKDFAAGHKVALPGLQAPDPRTVRIVLSRPYSPFLARLSAVQASIVPRDVYSGPEEDYLRRPVGSGPFRFSEWKPSQSLRLARFEGHPGGAPRLAGVEFRILQDPTAALEEYRRGGLDILGELPPGASAGAAEKFGDQYKVWPMLAISHFAFNHQTPPFAGNADLRRAINLAVDRRRMAEGIFGGVPIPASGIVPPGVPGFEPSRPAYAEDLEEARRLLARAGYPEGRGLPTLTVLYNTNPRIQQMAEQLQIDLARIGVRLDLRSADGAGFLQAIESGTFAGRPFHLARLGWSADFPDPDSFLGVLLHSRNAGMAGNIARYRDPEVDRWIDEARRTLDPARRLDLYRRVEERAAGRDACWLFLFFMRDELLVQPHVRGLAPVVRGDWFVPYERLFFGD
jgi:peptide/nickel transport system substrate-binding protein/oligopeptide transport system substrate-binding protein